jgi:twin BRCT domain
MQEITVTNYTGESREYLKKLILAMGAEFTPSMSGHNTVLVAALYVLLYLPIFQAVLNYRDVVSPEIRPQKRAAGRSQ